MSGTATHRPLAEPFSTSASWLARALAVSFVLHVVVAVAWWLISKPKNEVELVDIEVAPAPPKAEALPPEVAKKPEQVAAASSSSETNDEPNDEDQLAVVDAGVDA